MKPLLGLVFIGATVLALANCTQTNQEPARDQTSQTPAAPTPAERGMENAAVAIDDATITAKVKTALIAEPGISALAINVDTKDSVVTLTGKCDTQAHVDRAMAIAQSVEGVRSVTNNLTVQS